MSTCPQMPTAACLSARPVHQSMSLGSDILHITPIHVSVTPAGTPQHTTCLPIAYTSAASSGLIRMSLAMSHDASCATMAVFSNPAASSESRSVSMYVMSYERCHSHSSNNEHETTKHTSGAASSNTSFQIPT